MGAPGSPGEVPEFKPFVPHLQPPLLGFWKEKDPLLQAKVAARFPGLPLPPWWWRSQAEASTAVTGRGAEGTGAESPSWCTTAMLIQGREQVTLILSVVCKAFLLAHFYSCLSLDKL